MVDICILLLCTNPRIFPSNKTRCVYICGSVRDFRVVLGLQESQQYCWANKRTENANGVESCEKLVTTCWTLWKHSQFRDWLPFILFILFPTKTIEHSTEKASQNFAFLPRNAEKIPSDFWISQMSTNQNLKFRAPKLARNRVASGWRRSSTANFLNAPYATRGIVTWWFLFVAFVGEGWLGRLGNKRQGKWNSTRWWFQIFFIFTPIQGKVSNLTNIFQMGWNHQPVQVWSSGDTVMKELVQQQKCLGPCSGNPLRWRIRGA